MDPKVHWESIYRTKQPSEMSWYQPYPTRSIELLLRAGVSLGSSIIDIGGGDSTFVDALLDREFRNITVLDISSGAIERARARLGARANEVAWIEGDVRFVDLAAQAYDVWHDRAVFHFLTQPDDRTRYMAQVAGALRHGGTLIIATFALEGPPQCSGLPVTRYDAGGLATQLGDEFALQESLTDVHRTPAGVEQAFTYARFQRR